MPATDAEGLSVEGGRVPGAWGRGCVAGIDSDDGVDEDDPAEPGDGENGLLEAGGAKGSSLEGDGACCRGTGSQADRPLAWRPAIAPPVPHLNSRCTHAQPKEWARVTPAPGVHHAPAGQPAHRTDSTKSRDS